MTPVSRRHLLRLGGAALASLSFGPVNADEAVEIVMKGDAFGADVWFDPIGLLVRPGGTVTWRNDDPANSHTSTAYHASNRGHPLRIPPDAKPWNSDYLLPGETFPVMFSVPGVYDYFCIPHEMAGMVGRIVVLGGGAPVPAEPTMQPELHAAARDAFPPVGDIVGLGMVRR